MSDLRLRARSVTEIVDAAFQLYKRDALEYVLVTAIAYAPMIVAQLIFFRGLTLMSAQQVGGSPWNTLLLAFGGGIAYILMLGVVSRFASDVYLERPTGLGLVLRDVWQVMPGLIGATILFWLTFVLGFVPMIIGIATSSGLLVFLGVLLGIAWFFYALARFFAVLQLIVLERQGVIAAFARSGFLSQNRKGHILLTLFLVFVILVMLSFAVSIVGVLVGSLAGSMALSLVVQTLYTVVAYPLVGITQMVLYYDARIRAEGFDIEVMTGALGTSSATGLT